jgi:NAD(P)H-dependent FMN reductase
VLRELGRPTLVELLELTALIAAKDPKRYRRVAARWVFRYLQEHESASLEDVQAVAVGLSALGGARHDEALAALRGLAEEATHPARRRRMP